MSQNLITFDVTDQQVQAVRAALDAIEAALPGLISIGPDDRKGLVILGPKSEAFARQTLRVLEDNPRIVPPSLRKLPRQAQSSEVELLADRWRTSAGV